MIGTRIAPEKHAAVAAIGKKLGLNLQKTVERALDTLLANAGVSITPVPNPKPPRAGSISERMEKALELLDTLVTGQRHIQDGVSAVLREITRGTSGKSQEPDAVSMPSNEDDGEDTGTPLPADIAVTAQKHGGSPELSSPAKTNRPRKQGKDPGTGTSGGKH